MNLYANPRRDRAAIRICWSRRIIGQMPVGPQPAGLEQGTGDGIAEEFANSAVLALMAADGSTHSIDLHWHVMNAHFPQGPSCRRRVPGPVAAVAAAVASSADHGPGAPVASHLPAPGDASERPIFRRPGHVFRIGPTDLDLRCPFVVRGARPRPMVAVLRACGSEGGVDSLPRRLANRPPPLLQTRNSRRGPSHPRGGFRQGQDYPPPGSDPGAGKGLA